MNNHPYVKRNNTFPAGAKRRKGTARWSLLRAGLVPFAARRLDAVMGLLTPSIS